MPQIFKALASITVWVLFIVGWLFLVLPTLMATLAGQMFHGAPPPWTVIVGLGLGIISLSLSVVAMKLRQMLE
jgi:hypothetical protein